MKINKKKFFLILITINFNFIPKENFLSIKTAKKLIAAGIISTFMIFKCFSPFDKSKWYNKIK